MGTSRPGGRVYPFHGDEEVANVNGGNTFAAVQYSVNPGQATLFPWLSKEAQLYERYVFTQLEFYYQTLLNATSATAIGKVVYSMDFDAADPPPISKQQAMDSEPAVSCAPWENMCLEIPPHLLDERFTDAKYIRLGGLPGASDIKTYDLGNLNVVTDSNGATSALGELHVRYAGYFMNRVLESTTSAPNTNSVSLFQSTTAQSQTTTVALTPTFATTVVNPLLIVNTSGSFVPPAGNYLVDIGSYQVVAGATATANAVDFKKNGTSVFTGTVPGQLSTTGAATDNLCTSISWYVTANGTDAFTVVATSTFTGTITYSGSIRFVAI